jgi:hypothetical protein
MIQYSILSYRVNTYPDECVAVGLIFINTETGECKTRVSDLKMKIAKKILPNKAVFNSFKYYVKCFLRTEWTVDTLDHNARHQNGLVKLSRPAPIATTMDFFDTMFYKRLEENFIKNT